MATSFADRFVTRSHLCPRASAVCFGAPETNRRLYEATKVIETLFFLERLVHQRNELSHIEWLEEIASRPMPNAFHGRLQTAISGNDDDLDIGIVLLDLLQQVQALSVREFLIECNEVNWLTIQDIDS